MQKIWDSVDNRFGQMNYDNLFWNKTAKDLSMVAVRAVGWNFGDLREGLGGLKDTVTLPVRAYQTISERGDKGIINSIQTAKNPVFTQRQAYMIVGLPVFTGMIGATMNYLMTGEKPKELKDYYFPRTGKFDQNGRAERLSLPTYMKDVFGYIKHPVKAVEGKLNPIFNLTVEMLQNEDFYGTKIRNEDDPLMRQIIDSAKYVGESVTPISFRGYSKVKEQGGDAREQALNFFGFTPAPADVEKSNAEEKLGEIKAANAPQKPKTKEEKLRQDTINELVREKRKGGDVSDELNKAIAAGVLTDDDRRDIREKAQKDYLENGLKTLSLADSMKVYAAGTADEKTRLRKVIEEKAANQNKARKLTNEDVETIQKEIPDFKIDLSEPKNLSEKLKSASVSSAVELYLDRADDLSKQQKKAFLEEIKRKSLIASRHGSLTRDEIEKVKTGAPAFTVLLRPARPQRPQRSRTPALDGIR